MAASIVVTLRLTPEEYKWLLDYKQGAAGYATISEYLRGLLHHEHAKRTGEQVLRRDFDSEWRIGRPKQTTEENPTERS